MYRQGDVLLIPVDGIPADAVAETGPVILAHGEATGHAHQVFTPGAKLLSCPSGRFLRLPRPSLLKHQEHDAVRLPAGSYRVVRQREYSPEAIRNVAD